MMSSTARSVALKTLINVFNKKSYSNISLNHNLNKSDLSITDQNLATKLVYGTIQYRLFLEYQLKGLIRTKVKEDYIEPLLLMSTYQLFFLDKIPNRAVLDEANKLAKQFGKKNSSGFRLVNGILRSVTRRGEILPDKKNIIQYLSIKESFPQWMVEYFIKEFGQEKTQSILASFNKDAKNSIRISALADQKKVLAQLNQQNFTPKISKLSSKNVILSRGGIIENELFEDGAVTVQDEAASLPAQVFDFNGDEQVLDACSAPGGKTIQIAEQLTTGRVTALDIHENKLNLVKQNAKRLHVLDKVQTKAVDARKATEYFSKGQFDKILVDAPCSGLGLMRRKPEIRYTKKFQDLLNLSKIQLDILDQTAKLLKVGGEMVYSTCTISSQEDENVVKEFLSSHPTFELVPFEIDSISANNGMVKILPDEYGSDGFFIAKFKLRG